MSSNKPGNSFLRKASYVFPVKLLSNTKGPINLLPGTPHHTFTENLLWKLVTLVSCGLSWDHVRTFRKLFTPSRVKDASSLNKMTLNSSGWAFIQWQKSIRWAWSPGSRCVPFDHGKDTNLPHVKFTTPAYVIRQCERPFYEWTDSDFSEPFEECSLVWYSFIPPPFQIAQKHSKENQYHEMYGEFA